MWLAWCNSGKSGAVVVDFPVTHLPVVVNNLVRCSEVSLLIPGPTCTASVRALLTGKFRDSP